MNNDRLFSIYACALVAGIGSVITASIIAGLAAVPGPVVFLEHLAMSLGFRAAYKSFGGPVWWPYPSEQVAATVAAPTALPQPAAAASVGEDLLDAA